MNTKAASYLRVSGKGQIRGDGFPRQRTAIAAYATANRLDVVAEFKDRGVSGAADLEGREGLQSLFDRLAGNGIKVVIVERSDRIARDLMTGELILARFRDLGVQVLTSDGNDLTTSADATAVLVRQMLGAISEFDKTIVVRKLRAARDRLSARAGPRIEGRKRFGALPGEDATIERMKVLRRKPRGQARLGYLGIANVLNREKLPTRTGAAWLPATVRRVLLRG